MNLPYDPAIPLLKICPKDLTDIWSAIVMAAPFTIENRNNLNAFQSKNGHENMVIYPVEYSYKDK